MKKVKVMDVQFDVCTKDEALARIFDVLLNRQNESGKQIVTPNPEFLLEARKNAEFRSVLNRAWLSIPDGIGILWASSFQSSALRYSRFMRIIKAIKSLIGITLFPKSCRKIFPERITGTDLMESICALSGQNHIPIVLLGAATGIAEKVKKNLEIKYKGINIVGTFAGSPRENDFTAIKNLIEETQPAILFVAYGSPIQEMWINKHLPELKSVKIAMGVGGAFDLISGEKKRAPKLIRKLGMEWMFRLIIEPKRFKRIWNAVAKFPYEVYRGRS